MPCSFRAQLYCIYSADWNNRSCIALFHQTSYSDDERTVGESNKMCRVCTECAASPPSCHGREA